MDNIKDDSLTELLFRAFKGGAMRVLCLRKNSNSGSMKWLHDQDISVVSLCKNDWVGHALTGILANPSTALNTPAGINFELIANQALQVARVLQEKQKQEEVKHKPMSISRFFTVSRLKAIFAELPEATHDRVFRYPMISDQCDICFEVVQTTPKDYEWALAGIEFHQSKSSWWAI